MKYLILFLIFPGCAYGQVDMIENESESYPSQRQIIQSMPEINNENNCKVKSTSMIGNCRMDLIVCKDGSFKFDSKCYPEKLIMPWDYLPDPQP